MKTSILFFGLIYSFMTTYSQTWVSVGGGVNGRVEHHVIVNGELYISSENYDENLYYLHKWNGVSWIAQWSGTSRVWEMTEYMNQICAIFLDESMQCIIAKFNGSSWDTLGITNPITFNYNPCYSFPMKVNNNELYIGGGFTSINGVTANYIAKWDNSTWSALGNGLNGQPISLSWKDNILYTVGEFDIAGGISAKNIAMWDGNDWYALASGLLSNFIGSRPDYYYFGGIDFFNNELYISSEFIEGPAGIVSYLTDTIVKWDGISWNAVGTNEPLKYHKKMELYNNKLYFTDFCTTGKYLKTWNGANWSIDTVDNSIIDTIFVSDFFVFNNELYIGGEIYTSGFQLEGIVKLDMQNIFKSPTNLTYTLHYNYPDTPIYTFDLNWDSPDTSALISDLAGYKVYRNNDLLSFINSPNTHYYGSEPDTLNVISDSVIYFVTAIYQNPSGESAPSNTVLINNWPVNIQTNGQKNQAIEINPNPINDKIFLSKFGINYTMHINIYNMEGKCVYQKIFNSEESIIDVSSLNKGIYIIKLSSNKYTEQIKFIKE